MARGSKGVPVPQLETLRKRAGLSQEELAGRAGLTRTTIVRLEQGGIARYQTIEKLAVALKVTRERLIREKRERSSDMFPLSSSETHNSPSTNS